MKFIRYIFFLLAIIAYDVSLAQVGIGTVIPDTNAILDLNNSFNKGLLLPNTPTTLPSGPIGLMFYNPSLQIIQYRETNGFNGLSPWKYKFNGNSTENIYFIESGNVGIGLTNPQTKLHVKANGDLMSVEGSSKSYIQFAPTGASNAGAKFGFSSTTSSLFSLDLQTNGDIKLETNNGEVAVTGKIQEYGFDLLPAGTIMIWTEAAPPAGWAICNGTGFYTDINGVSRNIPNLKGLFVLGGTNSNNGTFGGSATINLVDDNLPSHLHSGSSIVVSAAGYHTHTFDLDYGSEHSSSGSSMQRDENSSNNYTEIDGEHDHDIGGTSGSTGNGADVPNLPPFITMYYIIKT